jgi:hypothetical protein
MPELAVSAEKIGFLIEKMREFDVKEGASDPDSGSNGADDNMVDVLADGGDDPVVGEITGFINAMTEDEQIDLVALMRLGRGDGGIEEWDDLRREEADGYDGRTATPKSSCPDLIRASIIFTRVLRSRWIAGSSPAMTRVTARSRR